MLIFIRMNPILTLKLTWCHTSLFGNFLLTASSFLAIPLFFFFFLAYNWCCVTLTSMSILGLPLAAVFPASSASSTPSSFPSLLLYPRTPFSENLSMKLSLHTHTTPPKIISLRISLAMYLSQVSFPKSLKTVAVGWIPSSINDYAVIVIDGFDSTDGYAAVRHYSIFLKLSSFIWERKFFQILHKLPLQRSSDRIVSKMSSLVPSLSPFLAQHAALASMLLPGC